MNNSGVSLIATAAIILTAAIGASAQPAKILGATGKLTMLRTHDQGTRYGPANDSIDAEIVIALNTAPGKSFGFQLRADDRNPSRRAMYDLLLQAYVHDWTVRIDYFQLSPERQESYLVPCMGHKGSPDQRAFPLGRTASPVNTFGGVPS